MISKIGKAVLTLLLLGSVKFWKMIESANMLLHNKLEEKQEESWQQLTIIAN